MAMQAVTSPFFKGFGLLADRVTNAIERVYKREVLRRIPTEILNELARIKIEMLVFEGSPYARTKTLENLADALASPDVKVLSYVKKVDMTDFAPIGGRIITDNIAFGIEDLEVPEHADDWKDVIVTAGIYYNAEGTAPEYILISVNGAHTHVKVYEDGALVYESTLDEPLGAWHTRFLKTVPYPTA
jgi:hypothetical protein